MYRTLEPDKIIKTLATLEKRISERFPGSGLASVCADLNSLARDTAARMQAIARPNFALRSLIWLAVALVQVTQDGQCMLELIAL